MSDDDRAPALIEHTSEVFDASLTATGVVTLRRWVDYSAIYSGLHTAARRADRTIDRWLDGSAGHRWLTRDPDPDVIVIDLTESVFLSPMLPLVERFLAGVPRAIAASRTYRLVERFRSAPLRALGGALIGIATLWSLSLLLGSSLSMATVLGPLLCFLFGGLAFRDRRSWAALRETRPVRILSSAFAPPDAPDGSGRNDNSRSRTEEGRDE